MRNISRAELREASVEQLNGICERLREEIFRTVSANGGHLSSNLGAVELTVALHRVFNFPHDKLVFDVGHQCYTHKLLSDRAELFHTLRKEGGISGFPKRNESPYDCYGAGHAGTAISAALGIAKARDLRKENFSVIALVGDGSFQNGLIFEALNSLAILKTNILIILNDNGMSISPTEGATQEILADIKEGTHDAKLFEQFGLKYIGGVNGNEFESLLPALEEAKSCLEKGSVLLHVSTRKGLGYPFSENAPTETHGFGPKPIAHTEYPNVLGEELIRLAEQDRRVVVITAAMTDNLGLRPFFERFPERAFDVGICEEHACVLAAALAAGGMRPYFAIYSTFLQRAFDEIIHDVCGQNLPVAFCIDHAGITGPDGETHQGVFDLSYLSFIPNLTVGIPKNTGELRGMLRMGMTMDGPLAIRYPRLGEDGPVTAVQKGKFEILHSTISDIIVFAAGERCIKLARDIRESLRGEVDFTLVNARFLRPLDWELLASRKEKYVVTLEDNAAIGGLGDAIARFYRGSGRILRCFGYADAFIPHGEPESLEEKYGLSREAIAACLREFHARG